MSFSHYWYRPMTISDDVYQRIVADVKVLEKEWKKQGGMVEYEVEITDPNTKQPKKEEIIIITMGNYSLPFPKIVPERLKEIFVTMKDGRIFQFTNVRTFDFDVAVQAFLIVAKHYLKEKIIVTSDGEDSYFDSGRAFVQAHLGYGEDFRLDNSPRAEDMDIKITYTHVVFEGEDK